MPTHVTPVKEKKRKEKGNIKKIVLSVLHLCVTGYVRFMSLCALMSLSVFVYILVLFTYNLTFLFKL